jgi:MFS family permease
MTKLLVLFVTAFVDMVGLAMIVPLLPYYAKDLGANATIVGLLISAFSVAQLACAPIWGRVSDRYGRRPAILFGLLVTAAAYLIFGFANSVLSLLLSRLVQGVGGGTIGVVQAYVADSSDATERTKSLGWLSAVTSLGAVAGPAFGSLMVSLGGRTAPGIGAAVLAAVTAGFASRFLRESHTGPSGAQTPATTGALTAIHRVITHAHEPPSRMIWIYAVAIGAFYGTIPTIPLLLQDRFGITAGTVGYVIMYLGGMGVVIRAFFLGPIVDRFGEPRTSRVGIVLLAVGLSLAGVARTYSALLASITLMPLGTAFLFPCITGVLSRIVPSGERGLYMGVQHTFGGLSRVAFPIGAGITMDSFGLGVPFVIAGVLVLVTLPLTGAMASYLRPTDQPITTAERLSQTDITTETVH